MLKDGACAALHPNKTDGNRGLVGWCALLLGTDKITLSGENGWQRPRWRTVSLV